MYSDRYYTLRSFTPIPEILPIEYLLVQTPQSFSSLVHDPNWPVYYVDEMTIPNHLKTQPQLEASGFRLAPSQIHRGVYCPLISPTASIQTGIKSWLLYDVAEALYEPQAKPQPSDGVLGGQSRPLDTDAVLGKQGIQLSSDQEAGYQE